MTKRYKVESTIDTYIKADENLNENSYKNMIYYAEKLVIEIVNIIFNEKIESNYEELSYIMCDRLKQNNLDCFNDIDNYEISIRYNRYAEIIIQTGEIVKKHRNNRLNKILS